MKKPTISNIKFELLSKLLCLSRWQTVGLLETLWLFAQHHAYDGELSKYSPKMIAAWFGWDDEPELLIEAFVEAGWIDRVEDRLLVHDWAEHAPNWVKGALKTTLQKSENRDMLSGTLSSPLSASLSGMLLRKGKDRKGKASKRDAKSQVSIPEGVTPETWHAWLAARKAKKLCEPTTAILSRVEREAAKIGWSLARAIQEAAERGWGGFEATWVISATQSETPTPLKPVSQLPETKIGDYVRKPKPGRVGA